MDEDADARQDLVRRIHQQRLEATTFLKKKRPRRQLAVRTAIVSSGLAAVFAAGPGVGGESFVKSVQQALTLTNGSTVWRALCLAAVLVSITATVSTMLANLPEAATQISAAEAYAMQLEGLETSIVHGRLPVERAIELYQQYLVKVPFLV